MKNKEKLTILANIAKRNRTMPILTNVHITSLAPDKIKCVTWDLEDHFYCVLPAHNPMTLNHLISMQDFKALYTDKCTIGSEGLDLYLDGNKVTGYDTRGYPTRPNVQFDFGLPNLNLQSISDLVYCSSPDRTRYNLCSVFIDLAKGKIVATDGHRMDRRDGITLKLPAEAQSRTGLMFTLNAAKIAEKFKLAATNKDATYVRLVADCGSQLTSRLVDGEFPAYSQITAKKYAYKMSGVAVKALLAELEKFCKVYSKDKQPTMRLDIDQTGCRLSTTDTAGVQYSTSFNGYKFSTDKKISIGINPRYFRDALKTLNTEKVDIELSDDYGAIQINTSIIMPMKLKD